MTLSISFQTDTLIYGMLDALYRLKIVQYLGKCIFHHYQALVCGFELNHNVEVDKSNVKFRP